VIFGVFAQVAKRSSFLDLFGEFVDKLVLERVDLLLELSSDLIGNGLPQNYH
jgi:hypothetical protein